MGQPTKYIQPTLESQAFNCAQCHVFARQKWFYLQASEQPNGYGGYLVRKDFRVSCCESCGEITIWMAGKLLYPRASPVELPNADMPIEIQRDYEEARLIANDSPRGAAALLRLAIQKLCKHLGKPGKNINEDIKALVADGLPVAVQQALDTVRVIGNEAVHPGTIDIRDNVDTAWQLFRLVNFICNKMITEPREISELYGTLPPGTRDAISRRDT